MYKALTTPRGTWDAAPMGGTKRPSKSSKSWWVAWTERRTRYPSWPWTEPSCPQRRGSTWIHGSKSKPLWLVHYVHVKSCPYIQYMSHDLASPVRWSWRPRNTKHGAGESWKKQWEEQQAPWVRPAGLSNPETQREKVKIKIKSGHHGRMWRNP